MAGSGINIHLTQFGADNCFENEDHNCCVKTGLKEVGVGGSGLKFKANAAKLRS